MRNSGTLWVVAGIMLLLDWYVFQAVKTVTQPLGDRSRMLIHGAFWLVSALTIISILSFPFIPALQQSKIFRNYVFAILVGLFLAKLLASLFFLTDDLRRGALWLIAKVFGNSGGDMLAEGQSLSRSTFLSWVGLGLGSTLFGTLLYGFSNKYNYQVKKIALRYPSLPQSFDGLRFVHISDVHSGSFQNKEAVAKGIDLILEQGADMILFTGDLVNDRANEMDEYKSIFQWVYTVHWVIMIMAIM
ncbi:MAG: hypothetical protein RL596_315 [Bacteroidota bacterium]